MTAPLCLRCKMPMQFRARWKDDDGIRSVEYECRCQPIPYYEVVRRSHNRA